MDDLNTAQALVSFDLLLINLGSNFPKAQRVAVLEMDRVFGLGLDTLSRGDLRIRPKAATITEAEIEAALAARKDARAAKDFATSDRIRDYLIAKGVEVMDGDPLGWDWKLDV